MRVLKRHKIKDKHRFECDECKTLLEVDDKELFFVSDPREGDAYTFKCCVCSEENWVAGNIVHVSRERGSHE